jgi:hypothetical protein
MACALCSVTAASAQNAPAAGKTAEQQFKNIQVLKGAPAEQVIPTMQYFNASLGVECDFCHVRQQTLEPAKDDKKEKLTARKMIEMTESINRANFEGKPEVGCGTCHTGKTHPSAASSLFDVNNPAAHEANRHDQAHQELPSAEQIEAAYEKAIGGHDAIQKLTTRSAKATVKTFQGQTFQMESLAKAPDLAVTDSKLPNGQQREQGFDGKTAWTKGNRGVNEAAGPELASIRISARFDRDLMPLAAFVNTRVVGMDKVDGKDCYVVRGVHADNTFSERLYFDKESGLLLRRVFQQRTLFGSLTDATDYSDYKEVNGVKVAFTTRRTNAETVLTRTLDSVAFNKPLDAGRFAVPAATEAKPAGAEGKKD